MTFVGATDESAMVGVSSAGSVFYAPLLSTSMPGLDGWQPPCPTTEWVTRSRNLGATWRQLDSGGPRSSGCVPPWMSVDPDTSRIWFPTTDAKTDVCGAHIWWSGDDGDHWSRGGDVPCPGQGAEKLLEGPAPASGTQPVRYPHVVYYCANSADLSPQKNLWCYRSLDGGQTFAFTGARPDPPLPAGCTTEMARAGVVGRDGVLYFPTLTCGTPTVPVSGIGGCCYTLGVAISRDEGASWRFTSGIATGLQDLYTTGSAVDRHGNLYFAYRGADALPYLVMSRDHGVSWSAPTMVAPPGVKKVQRVAVTARHLGEVALAYLGTADGVHYDGYITESRDVLDERPLFWSASLNAPSQQLINTANPVTYPDRFFYLSTVIGPDGTAWAGFHCANTDTCPNQRIGVVGRLTNERLDDREGGERE